MIDEIFQHLPAIAKKINISWKNKNIINSEYSIIVNGIQKMKDLNPDYEFCIHDDDDVEAYLQANLDSADYSLIKDKRIVEKTDLWRLLIIYEQGGIYANIERFCNIPFSKIITSDEIKCVLPTYFNADVSQDIIISCSGNPILKKAIDLNLLRRRQSHRPDIYFLGPVTYFNAATEVLLGKSYNRDPGITVMERLRELIHSSKHMKTYREEPFFNTITYRGIPVINDKNSMYRDEQVVQ